MNKRPIYLLLCFTWGLPMTLIGCCAALVLLFSGKKPQKWRGGIYFSVGKGWGGISLGPVVLTSSPTERMLLHEFGHSVQNCILGPFFPLIVGIPSFTRYWYRDLAVKLGLKKKSDLPGYHDIWFEAQADRFGDKYFLYL